MSDCIISTKYKNNHGYAISWYEGKAWKHHRLVFFLKNKYLPEVVMHTCDNPPCINLDHLVGGTQDENNKDRKNKSRNGLIHGERHGRSKVKDDEVSQIRDLYKSKLFSQSKIGEFYGITQSQVSKLILNQCFKGSTINSYNE